MVGVVIAAEEAALFGGEDGEQDRPAGLDAGLQEGMGEGDNADRTGAVVIGAGKECAEVEGGTVVIEVSGDEDGLLVLVGAFEQADDVLGFGALDFRVDDGEVGGDAGEGLGGGLEGAVDGGVDVAGGAAGGGDEFLAAGMSRTAMAPCCWAILSLT